MGCNSSTEAITDLEEPKKQNEVAKVSREAQPMPSPAPSAQTAVSSSPPGLVTEDSSNEKSYKHHRGYSSGGSSFEDSEHQCQSLATVEVFDLGAVKNTVYADGNLSGKVVRMETPFGKPIEDIYDSVHTGPVLGSGVSGIVRLVTHKATGVKYAVKCLDLGLIKSAEGLAQLREEIYIMCQLDHPNIVRLEEVYESMSEIYLVLELCHGGDLFDRLDEQSDFHYTEAQCARLVKQMMSSVRYLHSKGIIHRDLKLENFLFSTCDSDSILKMIDFGLSKHFSFGENHSEAVGTPYTVAPEIIKGSYNEKCDVWAIGVITYLLLSGETPFGGVDGEDLLKVRNNILTAKVLFQPAEVWDNVSSMAKDFVRVTLQKDPANRPTAKQAQLHPWLQTYAKKTEEIEGTKLNPNVVDALVSFKEYSDMHKLLCEVLSFTLLPEQISDLRKEFEKMDDGDGEISLADLKQVLLESAGARSLGGMTEQEIEDIFNALRVRKTETKIRWHEFIAAGLSQCKVDERNLKLAFDRIDSDRKGYITFDNVMDLVGETDAPENKEELKHMWMESIQHVNGNLDRITVDDFLRIMKGQTLGGPGEPSLERRISGARLDAVPEGKMSPQVKRSTADVMRFVGTSDEFYKEHAIPTLHEETSPYTDLEIQPEVSPNMEGEASDDDAERQVFFKLRSSSFEQKRPKYFDEDDEEFEAPATPRPSILLPTRSKKQIETLIEDESKTPLMVNKVLYRAHREMRLAVLEASKRFEEKQKRRELEKIMEERGKSGTLSPSIALVMRRASALPGLESRSAELTRPADDSVTQTVPRTTEEDAVEAACTRSGRPRRNRKKTVSDMSGMMGHKLSTSTS